MVPLKGAYFRFLELCPVIFDVCTVGGHLVGGYVHILAADTVDLQKGFLAGEGSFGQFALELELAELGEDIAVV